MQAEPALGIATLCDFCPPRVLPHAIPSPTAIFSRKALRDYCDSVLAALPSIIINTGVG